MAEVFRTIPKQTRKKMGWGGMRSTLGSRASRLKNNAMRVKLKEMPKCSAFDLNEA